MKKIEAFIRHEAFEPIRTELLDKGFPSLSITEVKGSGRQKGVVETTGLEPDRQRAAEAQARVVVEDKDKSLVVETILKHARTGDVGDGKIFVLPVEEAIRIRTGEEGETSSRPTRKPRYRPRREALPAAVGSGSVRSRRQRPSTGRGPMIDLHARMLDRSADGRGAAWADRRRQQVDERLGR